MDNLKPPRVDNEAIVEIRECTNNERNITIRSDSCNSESQIPGSVTVSASEVIDMGSDKADLKADKSGLKKDKIMKLKNRTPPPPGIKDDLTILAHVSLAIYLLIIIYLCLANPFTFFTWHPLLLALGWGLLTTESILFISKENPVVRKLRLNHTWKIRYHWILLTAATVFVIIGCVVVFLNKNYLNKQHFKHWHGFFGLLTLIGTTPAIINGTATLFDVNLKKFIKPSLIKTIHQASGTAAFIFGGITLILGVYTNWFKKTSGGNKYIFLTAFITVLYFFIWTLQRPFLKCLRKIFKVPF